MALEILSIVLSTLVSLIAIIVSFIAIKKQTQMETISANIQLFDKRFDIFFFTIDMWYVVGYFEGIFSEKEVHTFQSILDYVNTHDLPQNVEQKIIQGHELCFKYEIMVKSLFDGRICDILINELNLFDNYIKPIANKAKMSSVTLEENYKNLLINRNESRFGIEEINNYLRLSDIKRKIIK